MSIHQRFLMIMGSLLLGLFIASNADAAIRNLTFPHAVALAIIHQPKVAALQDETNAASRLVDAQKATFLPHVGLEAGALFSSTQNKVPDLESSNGWREITGQVVLNQKIYDPQAFAAIGAARAQAAFAHYRCLQDQLDIARMVARVYYRLQMQQAAIKIWKLAVNESKANLKATKEGLRAGIRSELDLLRIQTALRQAMEGLRQAMLKRLTLARLLMLMTGLSSLPPLVNGPPINHRFVLPSLTQLEATAFVRQPMLAAAESRERRAAALLVVARGQQLPHVQLRATYGWDTLELPWKTRPGWSVGINVSMPIFYDGERALKQAALLRLDAAKERLLQAKIDLQRALSRVWGEAKAALDAYKAALDLTQIKERIWQINMRGYRAGRLSSMELLRAQQNWLHNQQSKLADLARLRLMLAQMRLLTGQLPGGSNR